MAYLYSLSINRKVFKQKVAIDNLSDDELYGSTRFPRSAVQDLCIMLHDDLERHTRRSHALTVESQVITALQFYSSGSFQWMVGRSSGMSQSSVSRSVENVTNALCKLANSHITFPTSQQAILDTKLSFSSFAGFPNVVGAIDCTHIPIKAPSENEDAFVNRKGVHTINVQAVCDAKMKLQNVVARWPGSTHDSFVWRASSLHNWFESGHVQDGWLLGMIFFLNLIIFFAVYPHCTYQNVSAKTTRIL